MSRVENAREWRAKRGSRAGERGSQRAEQQSLGKSFILTYQELLWDSTDGAKATIFSER